MYLETNRLIVRSFKESDAEALYKIKTAPQVSEFIPDFLHVGAQREDMQKYIREFNRIEDNGDIDTWRCYAIELKETGCVVGCLSFSKNHMLHEYEVGWMMIGEHTRKGYASEAAEAFAEFFCRTYGIDYMIVVMDIDNPASRRTAEKAGFKLFEKRTVYDYCCNRYSDDYYYFRRYYSGCTLKDKYYGDSPYEGRSTSDKEK